ncbi:MAG: sulfatase [Rikenellaceae bacterium]
MNPKRRGNLVAAIAVCSAVVAPQIAAVAKDSREVQRPNFIIIFTDDQGYQDLGCFGSPKIKTPNIDKMADEGLILTNFYAQTVSGPSRQSLLTGCYPIRCARRNNKYTTIQPAMSLTEVTMAEILKEQGYTTHMIGKWDLQGRKSEALYDDLTPLNQGFDSAFWLYNGVQRERIVNVMRGGDGSRDERVKIEDLTRRYTDDAIQFLEENSEAPFLLYLAHTMPHTPLAASPDFRGKSEAGLYGDVVEEIDYNVGRLLSRVEELGLDDNTYVIYMSDNGPWWIKGKSAGFADPLRGAKTSAWDGGLRVPCIVRAPGRIEAATSCDLVLSTLDVMPTFAALAGAEVPRDRVIDGDDITKVLLGKTKSLDRPFFFYLHNDLRAVRYGKWKLHLPHTDYHCEGRGVSNLHTHHIAPEDRILFDDYTLYDLDSDIGETTNVAAENPKIVKKLKAMLAWAANDICSNEGRGVNARNE